MAHKKPLILITENSRECAPENILRKHISRGVSAGRKNNLTVLVFTVYILITASLNGCREKPVYSPTAQMDAPPEFWIRVLLLNNINSCELKFNSSFDVINAKNENMLARFDRQGKILNVNLSAERIKIAGVPFLADEILISSGLPHTFSINGNNYRGKLKLIKNADANSFDAINIVPLEPYLAGVVGAEMPDYWEPAALQAQAVAARTYCLYIKQKFGRSRNWDVKKTQANQAYHGIDAESAKIWDAVNKTYGDILTFENSGNSEILPAYYCSTCGGHTENSKNVFGGDSIPPLTGVYCPYCRKVAKLSLFQWKDLQFDKDFIIQKILRKYPSLQQLGKIEKIIPIEISDYNDFSRITKIQLIDANGKKDWLRAEDLRLAIDSTGLKFKSTGCRIIDANDKLIFADGKGFGHGVGMCQYGAEAIAREGKDALQILSYYYPGSTIKNLYSK